MQWIYLDNNATTQPSPEVTAKVNQVHQTLWANPSSVHRFGQMVRQQVELARHSVASLIGCRDRELVFTSGGTESNNMALRGVLRPGTPALAGAVLITTPVEHAAVREPAEMLDEAGVKVVQLAVDANGVTSAQALEAALAQQADDTPAVLVSIQWANNETGVIQPIPQLAKVVAAARQAGRRVLMHVDGTQAVGKLPVDVKAVGVDLLTLAAHKFHGPKGAGALYVRTGVRLQPQQRGGPQERDRRGGTENTAGIIGMGVAAQQAGAFLADVQQIEQLTRLRDDFEQAIRTALPETVVNSAGADRLWNTSNLGFAGLEAEAILLGLSEQGVCASAGAACSSGSLEPSPVLRAMGVAEPVAHGSVRFSLSRYTTKAQVEQAKAIVPQVVGRLVRVLPTGG